MTRESRPRLSPKARLRYDRKEDRYMLLYPEKGLALNPAAAEIVKLCTGEHSVAQIAENLARKYSQDAALIEKQALELLASLADRALVEAA